jgi:hypothetical protein
MTEHWSDAINGLPEAPCNTGCPRSTAGGLERLAGGVLNIVLARQSGCGWRGVCNEVIGIDAQQQALDAEGLNTGGLGNYIGDGDYIRSRYAAIQALRDALINRHKPYPGS